MKIYETILSYLNKDYRTDTITTDIAKALQTKFEALNESINNLKNNFYFDKLTSNGIEYFEKLLGIIPTDSQTKEDRRATIQAKWQSNNHNCIELIQNVCDAWKNGEIEADFKNGKIQINFVGSFGVPDDLEGLLKSVNEIKPAHIAYETFFKYLLIENIHEVKTIEQMEGLTLEMFAFGKEEI